MLFKGNIPTELVGKILGGYLELDDICSFDTASSNSYRISYILSCLNSVHIRRPVRVWNESQCRWIQLRKLKVTDLEFARGCGSNALCYLLSDCLSLESCSFSKLCWYKLDFVDDNVILSISKGCPNLKKLNIKNCPKISSKALTYLSHGCKQLNDIEIDSISISDDDIQNFSSECKNLEKISFRNCNITSNGLKYIATNCSSITDIDFSNTNITTQGFEFLLSNFLNIKSISLNPNNVTNEWLKIISNNCINLIYLSLVTCKKFTDSGMKLISEKCKLLKYLNINGSSRRISDQSLRYFSENLHFLEEIHLGSCNITDNGLKYLSIGCKKLSKLYISNIPTISDIGLLYLTTGNLLEINEIDFSINSNITNLSLITISQICHHFNSLRIDGEYDESYTNITKDGIKMICKNCNINLKELNLLSINYLSIDFLNILSQYCPNLISLTGIGDDITDQSLYIISQNCHKLKLLDISNKPLKNEDYSVTDMNITDQGIRILSEGCSLLESLTISSASQLTDLCLFYLGKNCKNLILFDWQDSDIMRNFTKEGFRNARLPRAFSYPFGFQI